MGCGYRLHPSSRQRVTCTRAPVMSVRSDLYSLLSSSPGRWAGAVGRGCWALGGSSFPKYLLTQFCHSTCVSKCSAAGVGRGDPVPWHFLWQLQQVWGANPLHRSLVLSGDVVSVSPCRQSLLVGVSQVLPSLPRQGRVVPSLPS